MITHVVLFRPRTDLDGSDRRDLAETFLKTLQQIRSITSARIGNRVTHGRPYEQLMQENYTHAAILEFDDLEGLKSYLEHPAHEKLAARFFASCQQALMYDFDMDQGQHALEALAQDEASDRSR